MSHGVYHDVTKHSRVRDAQRQLINLSLDVIEIDVAYLGDPVQENDEVRLRGIALGTESTVRSGVIFLYCSLDTVAVPAGPPAERFQGCRQQSDQQADHADDDDYADHRCSSFGTGERSSSLRPCRSSTSSLPAARARNQFASSSSGRPIVCCIVSTTTAPRPPAASACHGRNASASAVSSSTASKLRSRSRADRGRPSTGRNSRKPKTRGAKPNAITWSTSGKLPEAENASLATRNTGSAQKQ